MPKANIDELLHSPERREGIFNRVTANEESRTIELAFSSEFGAL